MTITSMTTYTVQYWNDRDAEWRGIGMGQCATRDEARQLQFHAIEQTAGTVQFRVFTHVTAV